MSNSPVAILLYRSLLRISAKFDAFPALKALLVSEEFHDVGMQGLYTPNRRISLVDVVRQQFRTPPPQAEGVSLETGFTALRYLNGLYSKHFKTLYPTGVASSPNTTVPTAAAAAAPAASAMLTATASPALLNTLPSHPPHPLGRSTLAEDLPSPSPSPTLPSPLTTTPFSATSRRLRKFLSSTPPSHAHSYAKSHSRAGSSSLPSAKVRVLPPLKVTPIKVPPTSTTTTTTATSPKEVARPQSSALSAAPAQLPQLPPPPSPAPAVQSPILSDAEFVMMRVDRKKKGNKNFSSRALASNSPLLTSPPTPTAATTPSPSLATTSSSIIESGILLVGHPLLAQPFPKCVLLILKVVEDNVTVLILNEPNPSIVGRSNFLFPESLRKSPCHIGGPMQSLQQFPPVPNYIILHPYPSIRHSTVLLCQGQETPLCMSTASHLGDVLKSLKTSSSVKAAELNIFIGTVEMPKAQLERQVRHGLWMPMQASSTVILDCCRLGRRELWSRLLKHCGGEFTHMCLMGNTLE